MPKGNGATTPSENVENAAVVTAIEVKSSPIRKEVKLVTPAKRTITGSIASFAFREANKSSGGKFETDTYILGVNVPKRTEAGIVFELINIFLSAKQYQEYKMKNVLYLGNYVQIMVEEHIAYVTGYKESAEDTELTEHTSTKPSFNGAVEATIDALYLMFDSMGVSTTISERIVGGIMKVRETTAMLNGGSTPL